MNTLNEELNRTKELMGLITEGIIFYVDLINFIGGLDFSGSKLGEEHKGIFRVGKDLGLSPLDKQKKPNRFLDNYKFTQGKLEDLPEGSLLPY